MVKMKSLLLLCTCFALMSSIVAQSEVVAEPAGFKIKSIDFSFGSDSDFILGMDANYFTSQLATGQQARLEEFSFSTTDVISGVCENPSLNMGLTLTHPKLANLEWRNLFSYKPNRIDAVTLINNSEFAGDYVSIAARQTELVLESALLVALPAFDVFNVYVGVGSNIGFSVANSTCVTTNLDLATDDISFSSVSALEEQMAAGEPVFQDGYHDCFSTGTQLNQRIFFQLGVGALLTDRVEVGMDTKYGLGYRADFGNSLTATNIVSTNMYVRYMLK